MFISLCVSIMLWVYVTSIDEDTQKQTYRGVRVVFVGEDTLEERGLIVSNMQTTSVTVTIDGPRREISKLSAADLEATIDLSNIYQPGNNQYAYNITYPDGVNSNNFQVITRSPSTIAFTVERELSKTVDIRGVFSGGSAEGYVVESGAMVFEPSTITVYGTAEELAKISYAQVTIDGENINATIQEERPFVFMNDNDEEVGELDVTTDVSTVITTVPVNIIKELKLAVDVVPGGGANKTNCTVEIYPKTVTLSGSTDELEAMNELNIGSINLSDYEGDTELTMKLPLSDDVQCVSGETEVTVTLNFEGLVTHTFEATDIQFINRTEGYKAGIVNKSLSVRIRAPQETMDKISAEDIRVVADLAAYNEMTGYVSVPVKIYIDGVTGAGAVGNYNVTVNLTK